MDQAGQKIDFMDFFQNFLLGNFFHINVVAWGLIGLFLFFMWFLRKSFLMGKLSTQSKFAPSVMTAAGLLGTFIGLSYGLKDLNLDNQASMQELVNGLKLVFVYSLVGVASSIFFMLLNMIPTGRHMQQLSQSADRNKQLLQTHNQALLDLLTEQRDAQQQMARDIAQLQFGNDNEELGRTITEGVVNGLAPMLIEIKNAVADQGGEAIRQVLDELKEEILVPMQRSLTQTNSALDDTNQTVLAMIQVVQETQQHNDRLIAAVGRASEQMVTASEKMNGLVDKIDQTVSHMGTIQEQQKASLDRFNEDLQANLAQIKPAIEDGLNTAKEGLTAAIGVAASLMQESIAQASDAMVDNLDKALTQAGTQLNDTIGSATHDLTTAVTDTTSRLNESVQGALQGFDTAQQKLDDTLQNFSGQMNGHLDRMATELEQIGGTAQGLIQTASDAMVSNVHQALTQAGTQLNDTIGGATHDLTTAVTDTTSRLNESVQGALQGFDTAQQKLDDTLQNFSGQMNGHLDRMATELEQIGGTAQGLIQTASDNLEKTLGDIDQKLHNTSQVLQESLETFRQEYQARLTQYLDLQQQRLDGFLDQQNQQLEQTIGKQREGLVAVTHDLQRTFAEATQQHRNVVDAQQNMLQRLDATREALLPKIAEIARELGQGEQKMVAQLKLSNDALHQVSEALSQMGQQLPTEFAKAFEQLDQKYREAFSSLDSGLADTVGALLAATEALVQASGLNDTMQQG